MEAVFLKLVNMSLTASWLVLAVLILRLLLKNAPKYIRVILWGFVGIRLVFPFSFESMFSMIPSSEPLPEEFLYAAAPQVSTGIPVINNAINPVISQSMAPALGASANPTQICSFIFSQIWILGMVLMFLYAAVSYYLVYRRVAASIRIGDNLRLCDHIETPFILGIFKPRIYLPSELDPRTADYVLAHEYAHLKRKDHWWKPLGFLLLCVYWFNPVMWLAYILLCRDIELACDEKVIRELGEDDKKAYSSALLRCSVNRKMIAACPLAFGEVGVQDRIKTVLSYKKPAFWVIVAAVVICVVVAVCFLTDPMNKIDPLTLDDWGITITAEEPSPTGVILAITIPENIEGEITIPDNQLLLELNNGEWIEVSPVFPADVAAWGSINFLHRDDRAQYQKVEWESVYGIVPPGEYRICKTLWLHQDGLSYQKDFYVDFVIATVGDTPETATPSDNIQMTILDSQHYSNGVSIQFQVKFPEFTELDDKDALYPQDVVLSYATKTGKSTAHVYNPQCRTVDTKSNTIVYDMRFCFTGQNAPTGKEFHLSISGFSNSHGTNILFTTPIALTWQADVTDAEILEYKQDGAHLRLEISPVAIHIIANGTGFSSMDELYDEFTILDTAGNRIDTTGSYGGSQGGSLIDMELLPNVPINLEQIGSIHIGDYQLTKDGDELYTNRLTVGSYIPIECVYMNPLSSYYVENVSNKYLYRVTDNYFLTENSESFMNINELDVDWDWKTAKEAGQELDFYRNWLTLNYASQAGLGLSDQSLYQKLNEDHHLILQPNGDLLLIQGHSSTQPVESVWCIFRLISTTELGEILKPYPDEVRNVWINGRDRLAPYIYLSPETAVEYSRLSSLDHAIRSAIMAENIPNDRTDGAWLESHIILGEDVTCGTTESGVFIGRTTLYVLSQLREVAEKNGQVEIISRMLIPAVLTFDETYEHRFSLREYRQARDWNPDALQNHFPESVTGRMLPIDQYQVQMDNDIHVQGIFYFDILPRTSPSGLMQLIAVYRQDFTFSLSQDSTHVDNINPWTALNSRQYSHVLGEYELEPIPDYSPSSQNPPMIQMRFAIDEEIVILSFFEGSDVVTLYQRNKLTAYRAAWQYADQPIGTIVRSWFDEAEYAACQSSLLLPIADVGQTQEKAVQEYCDYYYATHVGVSEGSSFRYSFVRVDTSVDMDATNLARTRGELDENGYAFWVTVYFVPDNDRAMQNSWAGNTYEYMDEDPTIPEGALAYTSCGYMRLTEFGWIGEILGSSF